MGWFSVVNLLNQLVTFNDFFKDRSFTPVAENMQHIGPVRSVFFLGPYMFKFPVEELPRLNALMNTRNDTIMYWFYIGIIVTGLLTTVGLWTRVSSILFAIGIVTLQHRNPLVLYGADTIMRVCAIYLAIGPSGASCSIDRLIRVWKGKETTLPRVSLWPQRLVQYQMALIYGSSLFFKWAGDPWRDGTATWYPNRLKEFDRFPYPQFMINPPFTQITTYGTLFVELALTTLVFAPPLRKYVLIAGLMMHAWIEYTMNIPIFGSVMCAMYISHYKGEEISEWAKRVGKRLSKFAISLGVPQGKELSTHSTFALSAADAWGLTRIEPTEEENLTVNGAKGSLLGRLALLNPALLPLLPFSSKFQPELVDSKPKKGKKQ